MSLISGRRTPPASSATGSTSVPEERAGVRVSPAWLDSNRRFYGGIARTMSRVSEEKARRHSAVFASRDTICRMVSTLTFREYKREIGNDGVRRFVPVSKPAKWTDDDYGFNPYTSVEAGIYAMLDSGLARGMAYGQLRAFDQNGYAQEILTVHPDDVTVFEDRRIRGTAEFRLDGRLVDPFPVGDLSFMTGYPVPGSIVGVSPISYAAGPILLGLHGHEFGLQWYDGAQIPTGVLENENPVERDALEDVVDWWESQLTGNRRTRALGGGWKYRTIPIQTDESQFLDAIQASVADVCRFFGIDPRDIGSSISGQGAVTYQNPELDQLRLLVRSLAPWIIRFERYLSRLRPRGRVIRADLSDYLRVDAKTRWETYDKAIRLGVLNPDEVRALEDRPEIPDGKGQRYIWPPYRSQLDKKEVEAGADSDGEDLSAEEVADLSAPQTTPSPGQDPATIDDESEPVE